MRQPTPEQDLDTLEARLDKVSYQSADSLYVVLRMVTPDGAEVTAVGQMAQAVPGEELRLRGRWEVHAKFGKQFRFADYELLRAATADGLARYLADTVHGLGPKLARVLVEYFGEGTVEALDAGEAKLIQVPGIGKVKAASIAEAWASHRNIHELMIHLRAHGLSPSLARRVHKAYGPVAVEVVERRPYRLARDVRGVGFLTADRIARQAGLPEDDPERMQAALVHVLREAQGEGHMYLPREKAVEAAVALVGQPPAAVDEQLQQLARSEHVVLEMGPDGEACYLPPMMVCERRVAWLIRRLSETKMRRAPKSDEAAELVRNFEAFADLELNDDQRAAVEATTHQALTVVTGGPGTGKTTITQAIVWMWQRGGKRVALAAPTGRAAKRLEEMAGHEAATIHRLLKYQPGGTFFHGPLEPLPYDLIIVDETSMVDMPLAQRFLEAVAPGTALLLVGDADQLPPVGPGAFFAEIVGSGVVPTVRLTQIYRQAAQSLIITNAHRLLHGEEMRLPRRDRWHGEDMLWVDVDFEAQVEKHAGRDVDPQDLAVEKIANAVTRNLPRAGYAPGDIQVLSPMRRGRLGVDSLNQRLQALLNPPSPAKAEVRRRDRTFRVGDRVLQTWNDYDKGVFNGEIGEIAEIEDQGKTTVDFAVGRIEYMPSELDELELAYALTVHKAQGSEYPAVVLVVHSSHFIMLRRNLLYTALTRAGKMALLIGDNKGLWKAIKTTEGRERLTRLAARLKGELAVEEESGQIEFDVDDP